MIISFNSHYEGADYTWTSSIPIDPDRAFDMAFCFLKDLGLSKSTVHTIVVPGVRESCIIAAYHALMGHFPHVLYPIRKDDKYIWVKAPLQEWRDKYRSERR